MINLCKEAKKLKDTLHSFAINHVSRLSMYISL
uniref:Uncharacterized protein n=1 Tax=Nelumbo nucifera TaxID=4432 RepID=A0A822YHC0_NELNU|nr:TPA_asm: hypothetical protein HUJ06_009226 [Nelumbo nucifera]